MDLLAALVIGAVFWLWTARSSRSSRAPRMSHAKLAVPTLGGSASGARVQPPQRERKPSSDPPTPPARQHMPITLGVAVLLQVLGLVVLAVLGALLVLRAQLDARDALRASELRATEQLTRARASTQQVQAELRNVQAALREQHDALSRLQARLDQLEQRARATEERDRSARPRTHRGH